MLKHFNTAVSAPKSWYLLFVKQFLTDISVTDVFVTVALREKLNAAAQPSYMLKTRFKEAHLPGLLSLDP